MESENLLVWDRQGRQRYCLCAGCCRGCGTETWSVALTLERDSFHFRADYARDHLFAVDVGRGLRCGNLKSSFAFDAAESGCVLRVVVWVKETAFSSAANGSESESLMRSSRWWIPSPSRSCRMRPNVIAFEEPLPWYRVCASHSQRHGVLAPLSC